MSLDSAAQRFNIAAVRQPVSFRVHPPAQGALDKIGRATFLRLPGANLALPPPTATISGDILNITTEEHIRSGGRQIIITLGLYDWVSQPTFDTVRQDIIDGLNADQSEATGWNNEVRDKEVVTAVARTNDRVVTITLSPSPLYEITARETITVTVPGSAVEGYDDPTVGAPTFDIFVTGSITDRSGNNNDATVIGTIEFIPFNRCIAGVRCDDLNYVVLPGQPGDELQGWFREDDQRYWRLFETASEVPQIEKSGDDYLLKNGDYAMLMLSSTSVEIADFSADFSGDFS